MKLLESISLLSLLLFSCPPAFATITIETVPIGNVGNPNDLRTFNHYGGVNYPYNIGKYEVTVGQYTEFLNNVAADDTYGLYNPSMGSTSLVGIARAGLSGSFSYSVIGSPNLPVSIVSWGDAARFANWLHNGQPTGPQNSATTEEGAYALNGAITHTELTAVTRNPGAKWFIPTENEWYKAAYHQPAAQGGDSDGYWLYPMKTNSQPYSDQPPGTTPDNTRVGNFFEIDGVANGYNDGFAVTGSMTFSASQNYLTDVGAYTSSSSFYGTFDQGGNVWEWNETKSGSVRGLLGGYYGGNQSLMQAGSLNGDGNPTWEVRSIGFRIASVPEPSTSSLIGLAAGAGFGFRPRRRL
jgi:formylglycine-generating enzyme